jgi:hypothetical protein
MKKWSLTALLALAAALIAITNKSLFTADAAKKPLPEQATIRRDTFGVPRQFGGTLLSVSYVGNRGTGLAVSRNINAVPEKYLSKLPVRDAATITLLTGQVNNPFFNLIPGTTLNTRTIARQQLLRPYPQFLDINFDEPVGYSWYHALQSRVERRFAKGFTLIGTWTWSKFMEATS